jgi:hypothetical protein
MFSPDELATEEWRAVPGFPAYDVSSLGRVRSRQRGDARMLKLDDNGEGYSTVKLCNAGCVPQRKTVHALVLEAFVGPRPDRMVVRHYPDADRANNRLANLSWGTYAENMLDRHVQRAPSARINSKLDFDAWLDVATSYASSEVLAARYGISQQTVYKARYVYKKVAGQWL